MTFSDLPSQIAVLTGDYSITEDRIQGNVHQTNPSPSGSPEDSSTDERKTSTHQRSRLPSPANVGSHHLPHAEVGEDRFVSYWSHKELLLPRHNPHLERFLAQPRQYVQVSQQDKQRSVWDGPGAAQVPSGTQLPRDAPLLDLISSPE